MSRDPDAGVQAIELPDGTSAWFVTGYQEARQALSDPRLSKVLKAEELGLDPELASAMLRMMLFLDPPDHTRLRRLISAAFTPRRVEALRPHIERIAAEMLDAVAGHETVDLVETFAYPLPLQVICELLGVPVEDRAEFRTWSAIVAAGPARRHEQPEALAKLLTRIRALLADRAARPGDDLLGDLLAVREEGDRLSEDELTSMVFMLVIAGHETTAHLIGSGVFVLLDDRDRWLRLRDEPELLPAAIEEFIRYEPPIAVTTQRTATEVVELGGQSIPAGSRVMVRLADANRDGTRFQDADEVRLQRAQNPHLGFGHGIHYCIGAPLARLQAQIAFTALMTRFPGLELAVPAGEVGWRSDFQRGVTRLPVRLRPAAPQRPARG
ncbi:cytochrome P450 [Kibdelosporangium persicum]|uniref:Mycinamicin IV hydroxylase/epoxidase n=1 Tax=Kibdelosporangium persicum TaxID=2698649 RepID=A0ABX2F6X5_9PSEU|nr:cytochrome P450 [Kibdelosporangium persicum]NRN67012.1 Mycinamicin IV hydroxylase/epoxidase [Kibdelosporangium persicum]